MEKEIIIYYCRWDGKTGSRGLLKSAAWDWCKKHREASGLIPEQFEVVQADRGSKPYFVYPEGVEFSISHTGEIWMCALSDTCLGLDVQQSTGCKRDRLSARFFHPDEDAWLEQTAYRSFFQVWAAKESYLKYTGDGLKNGMDHFAVADRDGLKKKIGDVTQCHFTVRPEELGLQTGARDETLAVCVSFRGWYEIRFQKLNI